MPELEKLRQIFVTEVDDDLRADNEAKIQEWEQGLEASRAYLSWKEHDFTKRITAQAKESFKEIAVLLYKNRKLTETERISFYAQQDAMVWLIKLASEDPKKEIDRIQSEIRAAINATS